MRTLRVSDAAARDNNLTLVRLVAALAVIWGHSFALVRTSGTDPISTLVNGHTYSGTIAVSAFFALSGFLVARSFWFRPNILEWLKQRIARIYPGLWVSIAVMLVWVFVVYRREEGLGFFLSDEVKQFVRYNAVLDSVRFDISGAFPDNRRPDGLIGSWWTLPGEIRVYLLFAVLAALGLAPAKRQAHEALRRGLFVAILFGLIAFSFYDHPAMPVIMDHPSYASPTRHFLLGAIFFYLRDRVLLDWRLFLLLLALPYAFWNDKQVFLALFMISTTYSVFFIGYGLPNARIERFVGDWSYGIYIYGWFVQQIVASLDPEQGHLANFFLSSVGCLALGALSWTLVERRGLSLARRIRFPEPAAILSSLVRAPANIRSSRPNRQSGQVTADVRVAATCGDGDRPASGDGAAFVKR